MKANPGKCHLLLSTKSPEVVSIDGMQITTSTAEILLDITIDSKLNFGSHINALGRIANIMSLKKRCIVMKAFIE